ncbi:hypothetical protein GF339_21055 [candidate division KSB3 bacterium]|uniref:Metallo-beta-lactamase domain-containing protein n=1 Tax=candidate division KSB3 bacterium TaxID=2044937 RepID=A0A9D5Q7P7_9BACT|nr:hypothetical protein [candidate division KSB3 bacterium]MBD3327089.1 hypothetical protein [candidate division KSB3 bacterium]
MIPDTSCRYQYRLVQKGSLPLAPDHSRQRTVVHKCTSVLLWPAHEAPASVNTVLTDPCFPSGISRNVQRTLDKLSLTFQDIGYLFITHRHGDHLPHPALSTTPLLVQTDAHAPSSLSGLTTVPCPGHAPELHALVFRSATHQTVWIVGDAILNLTWLKAWEYYWPNIYTPSEIVQTWESVATIVCQADIIIPGHGSPFAVTIPLLKTLIARFPSAVHAERCPDVESRLQTRLAQLQAAYPETKAEP